MNSLISSISAFIQKTLAIAVLGSGILLLAGEIRLAALKKASQGSSKLSTFTMKMTNSRSDFSANNFAKKSARLVHANQ